MRILNVRFKNLNSLNGEWLVDFTRPEYISNGIFAITGPTGAGKSTILDAICLALYGQTPRLDRITAGGNEIMSRLTGECMAEVTFESARGRYRCSWSQHRARRRVDGELQEPRHEISDADSGQILESKLKRVLQAVENATGMNFERFTRSMLLAQGGFAAFLQAPPDKRAPILEQMTGTAIYSQISMRVHQRLGEERAKLEALQLQQESLKLLGEAELAALNEQLVRLAADDELAAGRSRSLARALDWLDRVEALEGELAGINQQWQACEARWEDFQPGLQRLELAGRAFALEGQYDRLEVLKKSQEDEVRQRESASERLEQLAREIAVAREQREEAVAVQEAAEAGQQEAMLLHRQVRELDRQIDEKGLQGTELQRATAQLLLQCAGKRSALDTLLQEQAQTEGTMLAARAYLREHAADAELVAELRALEHRLRDWQARERQRTEMAGALQSLNGALAQAEQELALGQAEHSERTAARAKAQAERARLAAATPALLEGRDASALRRERDGSQQQQHLLQSAIQLGESLSCRQQEKASLLADLEALTGRRTALESEIAAFEALQRDSESRYRLLEQEVQHQARIRDLETERQRLVDGEPCPLCGALDHPFARGNLPRPGESEQHLQEAARQLKWAGARLGELMIEQAGVAKEAEQKSSRLELLAKEHDDISSRYRHLLQELDLAESTTGHDLEMRLEAVRELAAGLESRLQETEKLQQQMTLAQHDLEARQREWDAVDSTLRQSLSGRDQILREQQNLAERMHDVNGELEASLQSLQAELARYNIAHLNADRIDIILSELQGRQQAWKEQMEVERRLASRLQELGGLINTARLMWEQSEQEKAEKEEQQSVLAASREDIIRQRQALFGSSDVNDEEKRWISLLEQARAGRENTAIVLGRLETESQSTAATLGRLELQTLHRQQQIDQDNGIWMLRLSQQGFESEPAFLQARLPESEKNALENQAGELNLQRTALQSLLADKKAALEAEAGKQVTGRSRSELLAEIESADQELKALRESIGQIRGQLADHEANRAQHAEQARLISNQKKEYSRFELLHSLIGQADGKKYRNFAQGLTFEMLLGHANRQLEKLSDRYLLVRDDEQNLELKVLDNYQAGEIRSAKNLSGGESFLVSLALALGLSQMASKNVRVDSLFLDEGFGSLDEDALELALDTLASLHQEGKVIGIISHVPAIKERISTQIQVIPATGGRSLLRGPGCQKI